MYKYYSSVKKIQYVNFMLFWKTIVTVVKNPFAANKFAFWVQFPSKTSLGKSLSHHKMLL